jgi:putative phosphoribosyl transferase
MEFMLKDRKEAGFLLAEKLKKLNLKDAVVLAIPRGGVIIGYEIAKVIDAEFDIVTPRKLKAPNDPELAIGAIMPDGSIFLNEEVIEIRNVPNTYIEREKKEEMTEAKRRLSVYRPDKPYPKIKDRTVILVDDGIATGATMMAAARWAKKQNPKKIIIAIPVIPADFLDIVKGAVDEVIYLHTTQFFFGIGQFYRSFPQVGDAEVISILAKS